MVSWPSYFFCTECGAIHELNWNDLHDKKWASIMIFITEHNPKRKELAKKYGFTPEMAGRYLKIYHEMAASLVKSICSKGLRTDGK